MDLKTILLLLCSIILCSCKPPLVSFFPQRDNGMEKSLAKENHFSAEDVYADVCSQKAIMDSAWQTADFLPFIFDSL